MKVDAAGLPSRTNWRILGRHEGRTWLELAPLTGRTHQLRVHCAAMGWPIVGDYVYGDRTTGDRLHLHARAVSLPLYPARAAIDVSAPTPDHMVDALATLGYVEASEACPAR